MASTLWTILLLALPPAMASSLWSDAPGDYGNFITTAFPLGNGRLGAMPVGSYGKEVVNLNVDSLWRGGPFEDPSYSGGNPNTSKADALPGIRKAIFENGTGDIAALLGEFPHYGSYQVLGNLTIDLGDLGDAQSYRRELDLQTGVYTDQIIVGDAFYERQAFCSYPDQVCVYHLATNTSLPAVGIGLENRVVDPAPSVACRANSISLDGQTQPDIGMLYSARATVVLPGTRQDHCTSANTVTLPAGTKEAYIVLAADTNYDSAKGTAAANFSFRGRPPHPRVRQTARRAARKPYAQLLAAHVADVRRSLDSFRLSLPDSRGSAHTPTATLLADYPAAGDPFVDGLLVDYARYLFVSSSRPGSLPPNLQGLWTEQADPAWSADYHANINLQMNHWGVEAVGLGDQTGPLWTYMADTWVPRGHETARLLYGAEGWVTHDEMNIFGHTAMKNDPQWANYPAVNAWMAQHVWDHFDYSRNSTWYREIGYPMVKGAAQFWLSQVVEDEYFGDGTWVVNPCNSPEHGITTFGCTHYQQLLTELFTHILHGWSFSGDTELPFYAAVNRTLSLLDKGIHIGRWGQIQEWKMDLDERNDTHRHLSNLYGWYPGSSMHIENDNVTAAVRTTLISRGDGSDDQNTGWGKLWRAACWARLNESETAYALWGLAVRNNFAGNGLSMYGGGPPFQIEANLGVLGVVESLLVRDLDIHSGGLQGESNSEADRVIVLGPAIPAAWCPGSVSGLRLRGGGIVAFRWDAQGRVTKCSGERLSPTMRFVGSDGLSVQC